ncbi:TPA: hypothetical protein ACP31N_002369 [Pseudomonas aeruginosa]|uniref:hypothetical protein n=3 Tax=Pseudomonas aeruginosa TaxID=287 RepID=UPI0022EBC40E|nr:hypothetical protein [Pseudomonas aeruginosa]HCE3929230.1 hypothetical protein [Pseudomonas aeruginosa]HCE3931546.1 hypothetical protein [Pseudomonas aeruginosa]
MNDKNMKPSYREFMRARRPELYSDTLHVEVGEMDRRQFEFHLDFLTSRKEETAFENFARVLGEKELCPNLIPQTGPTGGGDSKVDTETYPVAPAIATLWYEGIPASASQRWGFAISAKADWKPKVRSDVAKIVATGRPYTLIYFISNQAIKDKDRADMEDALTASHGVQVRILDRNWIIEKVVRNRRWDIVAETLQFELMRKTLSTPGPLDVGRLRDLEALDKKIEAATESAVTLHLVEESLQSALLARGLDRPRYEVDGRFDRADRLAQRTSSRQRQRILYHKAWTALWWFDDSEEAARVYDRLAAEALSTDWIWDIECVVNLWLALQAGNALDEARTAALRAALQRHADDKSKETSSLWAQTQLLQMDLVTGMREKDDLQPTFAAMRQVLSNVRRQIEFPIEPVVLVIRELATIVGDSPGYDELLDAVIEIERERNGDRVAGELQLQRGLQKLERKKPYDAIDDLARAQILLAQEDCRDEFIAALCGTGLAYESAGLLYAARANLASALDRCLYSWFKEGAVDHRALPVLKKLAWLELQLGRVPYVLAWVKWFRPIQIALSLNEEDTKALEQELRAIDRVLGILILRTAHEDWASLTRLPDVLSNLGLEMSRAAALFMLGHVDMVRAEYDAANDDLNQFASEWLVAPAAQDVPNRPLWHFGTTTMTTVILGCQVDVIARGGIASALLGESIIGFLEAFYSTTVRSRRLWSPRERLVVEVRQSEAATPPFVHRHAEDECGETRLVVTHPVLAAESLVGEGFERQIFELFAHITFELQLGVARLEFKEMFAKHRAQDRAYHVARSIISVTNILGNSPPGRAEDWVRDETITAFPVVRDKAWTPNVAAPPSTVQPPELDATTSEDPPLEHMFGADALRHRDLLVMSPINLPLWDKAKWKGTGVVLPQVPGEIVPPIMGLAFENFDAGKKIFRGWHKKVGAENRDGWLGVTVITGIRRDRPLDYRVAIGISESYMATATNGKHLLAMAYRMHDMTPSSSRNLDALQNQFRRAGLVFLMPVAFDAASLGIQVTSENYELGIQLSDLRFIPAWQVEETSPLLGAMHGITDPVLPPNVTEAPFLRALERIRAKAPDSYSASSSRS